MNLTMSPDGKYVAGRAPIGDGNEIGLLLIDLEKMKPYSFKWSDGYDVDRVVWGNNETIVFIVSKWNTYAAGLHKLDRNKRKIDTLIGEDAAVRIVDPLIEDPKNVLVWMPEIIGGKPRIARVKLKGSAMLREAMEERLADTIQNPLLGSAGKTPDGDLWGWTTDGTGQARIVKRFLNDKYEYIYRETEKSPWSPMEIDPELWYVVGFSHEEGLIYVSGYDDKDTIGLYLYDLNENRIVEEIFRDPYYDYLETAHHHFHKGSLIGIAYDKAVPTNVWFAPEMQNIQKMVDQAIPGKANIIYDWSADFSRFLIYSHSDSLPIDYILLDLETKQLRQITPSRPWLDNSQMSRTQVLRYKTPDGLTLEGYLTLPKEGKAPYPMVCLVHGGPSARDTGTFDSETQFLANRGYAVLRVNFRGSSGFGKKVSLEPQFDILKMQEDIAQAVNLVADKGIADRNRLAIMRASFGGYSALCGATMYPDLYRCAITIVGVFDWELLLKNKKRKDQDYAHHVWSELGDPKEAKERFEAISPINHVDKIKIPIYVAHGKSDSNVSVQQSKRLVRELKKHDVPHQTFFREWEGHGFFDQRNSFALYREIERFLAEHL